MAYEEPERRSRVRGGGWLWGLLVVLALVLIVWWLWPQTADVEPVDVEPDVSLIAQPELIQTTL